MKIIKLSHPLNWLDHGHWDYRFHFPGESCVWQDFRFEINNECAECDFWIIHESLESIQEVSCSPENVILVTSEEKPQVLRYNKEYLSQFGMVVTSRDDVEHPKVLRTHYMAPWRVLKTYDELMGGAVHKTRDFSAVISNNVTNEGHLKRYAFTNKLQGHFKYRMDWFCKGEKPIEDKWDGLAPYQYSLAIENSSHPYYFTEKIMDCFLAETMPVYWGCTNIAEYFPEGSFLQIDTDDYIKSIDIIEEAISSDLYSRNLEAIRKAKDLVLNKYQFVPAMTNVASSMGQSSTKKRVAIKPREAYTEPSKMKKVLFKVLSKIP